jgi:hypothetical protein
MKKFLGLGVCCIGAFLVQAPANAGTVTGSIQYFVQPETGAHDFGNPTFCCGAHYTNEVTGTLGINGLPVYNSSYGGPALTQVNGSTGELTWWSTLTSTGSFTTNASGLYDQHLFTPNGTGSNNSTSFQTAILTTNNLLANTTYNITYSGDDDVFLAINGQVFSQDGGVHAIGQVNTASFNTGTADNQLEIFFADRYNVQSELQFTVTPAVPEPSTWAMMILGFCGLGFIAYRRKAKTVLMVA